MDNIAQHKGFVIHCDQHGKVLKSKMDNLLSVSAGDSLIKYVDPASIGKVLSFLTKVVGEESAIGWEVNFKTKSKFHSVYLAGVKEKDYVTVIGTTDAEETRKYFNDLTLISNQQVSELRSVIKENIKYKEDKTADDNSFNELTKINNEMANVQRELAKKNNELSKLNKTLEQKNQELDHFAYIVSHDLKAPLRGITSILEMIEEDFGDDIEEDIKEMFALVKQRSKRMNDLIGGILSYSRAGKMDSEANEFNLKEMITEIMDSLAVPDSFKFIIPEELPDLNCSYIQLGQVMANLMGNAVKYHHQDSGNVELRIKPLKPNWIRYSVIDDGPGIPKKYHDKLFKMFETANEESRVDSTGVGLAIVQKLVEHNGGQIGLNSEVGKGSEFWFTWPINAELE